MVTRCKQSKDVQQQRLSEGAPRNRVMRQSGLTKRVSMTRKGDKKSAETRRKMDDATKANWQNPDYRKKHVQNRWTEEKKQEHSNRMVELWNETDIYTSTIDSPEAHVKAGEGVRLAFQKPDVRARHRKAVEEAMKKALRVHYEKSGLEIKLHKLLQQLGLKYSFVGNRQFHIEGKCPDFKHDRFKWLIEAFGSYYHAGKQ